MGKDDYTVSGAVNSEAIVKAAKADWGGQSREREDLQDGSQEDKVWRREKAGTDMQLKLASRVVNNVLIVDCSGRIVFGEEAGAIRDFVKGVLAQHKQIVLNLKNVSYIDSGGLGTLVGLYTSAHSAGGDIRLSQLTQRVGQLLQVTKLVTVFHSFESDESAVNSFAKLASA